MPVIEQAGSGGRAELDRAHRPIPVAYYVGHAEEPQTPDGQPVFDTPTALLQFVATHLEGID
jgi:hypothetical protein